MVEPLDTGRVGVNPLADPQALRNEKEENSRLEEQRAALREAQLASSTQQRPDTPGTPPVVPAGEFAPAIDAATSRISQPQKQVAEVTQPPVQTSGNGTRDLLAINPGDQLNVFSAVPADLAGRVTPPPPETKDTIDVRASETASTASTSGVERTDTSARADDVKTAEAVTKETTERETDRVNLRDALQVQSYNAVPAKAGEFLDIAV